MPVPPVPARRRTGPQALRWPRSYRPQSTLSRGTCFFQEAVADSPVAYWRLGELSGNPQDSVGTNHVTALVGTAQYGQPGFLLPGDPDYCVRLGGAAGFVTPDAPALDVGDNFTIEFAIRPDAVGLLQTIFDKGGTGGDAPSIIITSGNNLSLFSRNVGHVAFGSVVELAKPRWYGVTKSGATTHWYTDGAQITDDPGTNTAFANSSDLLFLGCDTNSANFFTGLLDEVVFYRYALSGTRMAAHYAARSIACTLPIWYPSFFAATQYDEPTDSLIEA